MAWAELPSDRRLAIYISWKVGPASGLGRCLQSWERKCMKKGRCSILQALVDSLASEYCTGDFHAAGMSAGGDMTSALQCLEQSPFGAYAPVTYLYYNAEECGAAPPRPMIYFHGSDDFVVPIDGSGPPWNDPPVPEAMQRWASHNGCEGAPEESRISDEAEKAALEKHQQAVQQEAAAKRAAKGRVGSAEVAVDSVATEHRRLLASASRSLSILCNGALAVHTTEPVRRPPRCLIPRCLIRLMLAIE